MADNLVIVESPAKAKTLKNYLGNDYQILASYGHVRDLMPKTGAVDPDNNFSMKYELISKNSKHVSEIIKAIKKAKTLLLATDPDREGEAIAWHIHEILKEKKALKNVTVGRVAFNQITKKAILEAINNPREISQNLVDAQQARRALDYLVGFNLSPLLWKKIRTGLSAGRVQSPALKLIVVRELEIEAFKTQEYWSIKAHLKHAKHKFTAKLIEYRQEKLKQFSINNAEDAKATSEHLTQVAQGHLRVSKIEEKAKKRQPTAPFITSTLQQEAARKLGFTASRTMRIAQQLYEGVDIGGGQVGLITYMRTDSVNMAAEAIAEIRELITKRYGAKNLPKDIRVYKTKAKNAQEAHEAIRPTSALRIPADIQAKLSPEQAKLYDLIWKRTIASQMLHATINTVSINFNCADAGVFRASGSVIANPGFIQVYQEGIDDSKTKDEDNQQLPKFKQNEQVPLESIEPKQHFTEPPPRYGEASLIKTLEEHGIGRPSTYAAIISTIQSREYAILDQKRFKPTDIGRIVNKFLNNYFDKYVDYGFTAGLENELDAISRGEKQWQPVLKDFWDPFKDQISVTEKNVKREDVTQEKMDEKCPECSNQLSIRLGKKGRFIGCTNYPECKYTRPLDSDDDQSANEPELSDKDCPKCSNKLAIKMGRYGKFYGCSNYPECKHMEPLIKPVSTGVECPQCKKGTMHKRISKRGNPFYSCDGYPKCKYVIWNEPLTESCPKCTWPILTLKVTKRHGEQKVCPQKDCDYIDPS